MAIRKLVIPAAGLGTRFLPCTKVIPKELLPLLAKPAIHYLVQEAVASGLTEIILVTASGKSAIADYFDRNRPLEAALKDQAKLSALQELEDLMQQVHVVEVRQPEPLGLGHAVLCAQSAVGQEDFAVALPDDLILSPTPCFKQMLQAVPDAGLPMMALLEVPPHETHRYGIAETETLTDSSHVQLSHVIEKPKAGQTSSRLAIMGRYILPHIIFEVLRNTPRGSGGEIQLTDAILRLKSHSHGLWGYRFEGQRYDLGTPEGFLEATIQVAAHDKQFAPLLRRVLGEISW